MQGNSAVGGLVFWFESMENDGCIQICPKSWLWRLCVHTSVCDMIYTRTSSSIHWKSFKIASKSSKCWALVKAFDFPILVENEYSSSNLYLYCRGVHKIQIPFVNHRWSWIASNPMTGTVLEWNCMTLALFSYHSWKPESGWSQLPLQHPFSKSNSSLGYFGTKMCSNNLKQR